MTWPLPASLLPFQEHSHPGLYPLNTHIYAVWWYNSIISHTIIPLPRMPLPSSVPLSLSLTQLIPPHIPVNRLGILSFRKPPWNLQIGLSVPLDFHISIFIYHFTVQVMYFCLSHLLPHWTRSYSRAETRTYLSSYSKGLRYVSGTQKTLRKGLRNRLTSKSMSEGAWVPLPTLSPPG